MGNNKVIDSTDPGIVIKETTVQLSDEKLKNLLSHIYEISQEKTSAIKFYKFYGVFLSIAGTLFLTLLTSSFKQIGPFGADVVTKIAWCICIASAVLGFILLCFAVNQKLHYNCSERDETVEKELEKYFNHQ